MVVQNCQGGSNVLHSYVAKILHKQILVKWKLKNEINRTTKIPSYITETSNYKLYWAEQ